MDRVLLPLLVWFSRVAWAKERERDKKKRGEDEIFKSATGSNGIPSFFREMPWLWRRRRRRVQRRGIFHFLSLFCLNPGDGRLTKKEEGESRGRFAFVLHSSVRANSISTSLSLSSFLHSVSCETAREGGGGGSKPNTHGGGGRGGSASDLFFWVGKRDGDPFVRKCWNGYGEKRIGEMSQMCQQKKTETRVSFLRHALSLPSIDVAKKKETDILYRRSHFLPSQLSGEDLDFRT